MQHTDALTTDSTVQSAISTAPSIDGGKSSRQIGQNTFMYNKQMKGARWPGLG